MALKISVAIATWQRKELLSRLILALEEQTISRDDYEIIVCDSGSADGTNEMMGELCKKFSNIKYVNLPINTLSAKRNEGIRRASAPIVIFMDDDVQPVKTFLEAHLRAHNASENVVFCGQIRFPAKWIERSNYFRFRDSRHLGYTRPEINHLDIPFMMLVVMNLSFKREEILRRVGWVCEEFTHYGGEDHEFAYRISLAGIRIEFVKEALAYHCEAGGSIGQYMKKMFVTARDSAPLLHSLVPGVWDMGSFRYFEASSPADKMSMKMKKWTLRLATSPLCSRPVQTLLEKTDHIRFFYFPPAFRFLFAAAFAQGVKARELKNSNYPLEESTWF